MSVSGRTLRRWRQSLRTTTRCPARGRPRKQSSLAERTEVLKWLDGQGPHLGSPALRAAFPGMPRCELLELQRDWREGYRLAHPRPVAKLTWHVTGRVWAADHTQPPQAVDGTCRSILCIRDLASGMQLAWHPVPDLTAPTTGRIVEDLFREHGAPLVLKTDNGSAFIDQEFAQLLLRHGVAWLPSPPRTPTYNGSCEAANAHGKLRTAHFALHDHQGCWTATALEQARSQANHLFRPEGHLGPTPAERWHERTPIAEQDREALARAIAENRKRILRVTTPEESAKLNHQRHVTRSAVRRALTDLGLLTITWRSITPPFKLRKADTIS